MSFEAVEMFGLWQVVWDSRKKHTVKFIDCSNMDIKVNRAKTAIEREGIGKIYKKYIWNNIYTEEIQQKLYIYIYHVCMQSKLFSQFTCLMPFTCYQFPKFQPYSMSSTHIIYTIYCWTHAN